MIVVSCNNGVSRLMNDSTMISWLSLNTSNIVIVIISMKGDCSLGMDLLLFIQWQPSYHLSVGRKFRSQFCYGD